MSLPCRRTLIQTFSRRQTKRGWHCWTVTIFVRAGLRTLTSLWCRRTLTQRAGMITLFRTVPHLSAFTIFANPITLTVGWPMSSVQFCAAEYAYWPCGSTAPLCA